MFGSVGPQEILLGTVCGGFVVAVLAIARWAVSRQGSGPRPPEQ